MKTIAKIACDHYHLFDQDFTLAQKLGHNAHRQVLTSLKKHKLVSFVTLQHFTLPLWFSKMGGWENPQSPEIFARYVHFCAQNLFEPARKWFIPELLAARVCDYFQTHLIITFLI